MLVSYLWLKDLVEFDHSPEELAVVLTGLGLECSIADDRRGWYENIVIGKVLEAAPHPNADKLSLCKVDVGGEVKSIVCGAPNVAKGQTVPVALIGAKLPGGMKIEKRKVRGELSEGMICSESELELSDDHGGIMELDGGEPGESFSKRYEVCDTVLEVDLTPNRGDCLSMIGIAREVAAAVKSELRLPSVGMTETDEQASSAVSVRIDAPDLCPRYAARVIKGVRVAPSPFWIRRRLNAVGVRAINNMVDVTNYVLMEAGHPLHAFDYDLIGGKQIIVRRAGEGEEFVTLDGGEHRLSPDNLVIADAKRAVALAGVMGGQNSEVSDGTKDILLESAFFNPRLIRRTSRTLNISSESSYRFERGTDVEGLIWAQDRAASLMVSLGGGAALKGRVDACPAPIKKREVSLRFARLNKILGIEIDRKQAEGILERLLMEIKHSDAGSVTVLAPHFRFDIEREIDLIEEIARCHGYDKIPPSIPRVAENEQGAGTSLETRRSLRRHLRSLGMMEGLGLSFMSEKDLERMRLPEGHGYRRITPIDNPLTSEWTHLRSTMLPGLISAMKKADDAQIFEIGVVFEDRGAGAPLESWNAAAVLTETVKPGLWTGRAGNRDFFHLKGVVESVMAFMGLSGELSFSPSAHPFYYPRRQADIHIGDKRVGDMGQIHPETLEAYDAGQELFCFQIDLDRLSRIAAPTPRFKPLRRFPSVKRDLAVVAPDEVTVRSLTNEIMASGGDAVKHVELFDIYRGDRIGAGKKSMAFSLEFYDEEKTLTDDEADRIFGNIVRGLKEKLGAELR